MYMCMCIHIYICAHIDSGQCVCIHCWNTVEIHSFAASGSCGVGCSDPTAAASGTAVPHRSCRCVNFSRTTDSQTCAMFSSYFTHTVRPKKEKPDAEALAAADAERERQRKEREVKFLQKAIAGQEHAALKVKAYEILGIKKGPDGNPDGYQRYGNQSRAIYWVMFLMRWVSEWIMRKKPIDELASDAGFANAANKEAKRTFLPVLHRRWRTMRIIQNYGSRCLRSLTPKSRLLMWPWPRRLPTANCKLPPTLPNKIPFFRHLSPRKLSGKTSPKSANENRARKVLLCWPPKKEHNKIAQILCQIL
jgi:hypothetical protein